MLTSWPSESRASAVPFESGTGGARLLGAVRRSGAASGRTRPCGQRSQHAELAPAGRRWLSLRPSGARGAAWAAPRGFLGRRQEAAAALEAAAAWPRRAGVAGPPTAQGARRSVGHTARLSVYDDPQTGAAPGLPGATMCVQDADDRCVLQFTLHNAAGCALHRRASRVIHRSELCFAWSGPCVCFASTRSARQAAPLRTRALARSLPLSMYRVCDCQRGRACHPLA